MQLTILALLQLSTFHLKLLQKVLVIPLQVIYCRVSLTYLQANVILEDFQVLLKVFHDSKSIGNISVVAILDVVIPKSLVNKIRFANALADILLLCEEIIQILYDDGAFLPWLHLLPPLNPKLSLALNLSLSVGLLGI